MERMYTYKFRLYPNREQETYLANVFGCCRLVYNHFLDEKKKQYKETKTSDSYNVQSGKLTLLRKTNEFEFLNAIPLQSLQCSLRNMHTAYENFYKHRSSYPKFKNRRDKQSFKIAQPNTFHIKDGKLFIPKLKSGIDIVMEREIIGKVCFATISKNKAGRYHITITVKQDYEPFEKTNRSVGLDLGIKELEYKCDWNDKTLIKIDRYYPSSQMCNECGYVEKHVKNLNVREWTCCNCGSHHDRDVNAARNILRYNSARNVENSRGAVYQPFVKPKKTGEQTDNCEATIELEVI